MISEFHGLLLVGWMDCTPLFLGYCYVSADNKLQDNTHDKQISVPSESFSSVTSAHVGRLLFTFCILLTWQLRMTQVPTSILSSNERCVYIEISSDDNKKYMEFSP